MGLAINRRGLKDWLAQRITAVAIGAYTLFILLFCVMHPHLSYNAWHGFMGHLGMKIFTLVVILAILWHAWIGLWTVLTDYVKNRPCRLLLEVLIIALLLAYAIWVLEILWK